MRSLARYSALLLPPLALARNSLKSDLGFLAAFTPLLSSLRMLCPIYPIDRRGSSRCISDVSDGLCGPWPLKSLQAVAYGQYLPGWSILNRRRNNKCDKLYPGSRNKREPVSANRAGRDTSCMSHESLRSFARNGNRSNRTFVPLRRPTGAAFGQ